ncbi:hypothetical protein [Glutamicibacter nicotianae]|uniref:hypothetical protein n=1 Tax=Glutamicibacter nicotianae TaxID=37929 RepID=UPI00167FD686|nr:hypothetical protein [Glutamicibacter nicotianae]
MNQPPLNPDARTECVDMLLEIMGYPRDELFEYPNRADDSREYIARSERTLDKILAVAQPEVNSANFPNVNRVEVIRDGGRALTVYGTEDVFYDIQDEGRTLKIFMKVPSPDYSAYRKAPYPERNLPEVKP